MGTGKGMTNNVAENHALTGAIKKISDLELEKERIVEVRFEISCSSNDGRLEGEGSISSASS